MHVREFIETRRHWFTKTVPHDTRGGVHMLNLVEGAQALVESPSGAFEPVVVHYAKTFIVPVAVGCRRLPSVAVGCYTICPHGPALAHERATMLAFVRT